MIKKICDFTKVYFLVIPLLLSVLFVQNLHAKKSFQSISYFEKIDEKKQAQLEKEAIFNFLKSNNKSNLGEGLLFLANHFYSLQRPEIALDYLKKIVANQSINIRIKAEAQLLLIKILLEQKPKDPIELKSHLDKIIKEYYRLLSWNIPIDLFYKAKYELSKVLAHGVTTFDDLITAFYQLYSNFPDLPEPEELQYLMGFKKGYNLETAMKGLEIWEELTNIKYEEFKEYKNASNLQISLFYAYDLNCPENALNYLSKIDDINLATSTNAINKHFVLASLFHIFPKLNNPNKAILNYNTFIKYTKDLQAYRVANILLADLLSTKLNRHNDAINILEQLASPPLHLFSVNTISLKRQLESEQENYKWAVLCYKIAGYIAEYRLLRLDLARVLYLKAKEYSEKQINSFPDFWLKDALKRLEPSTSKEELEFRQAYEKYRARDTMTAIKLYEEFAQKYPNHFLAKEALYRAAILLDDELKKYDEALEKYQNYIINVVPVKSSWKLDVIYDFNRLDEVRYRIGILYAYHLNEPYKALKYFDELTTSYPDSYWAVQAQKEAIKITKDILEDINSYNQRINEFIKTYPNTKEAQEYRLSLYKNSLSKGDYQKAYNVLKDYVTYASPEQSDYLQSIKNLQELQIQIKSQNIKNLLAQSNNLTDICLLYESLIDILSLASSAKPLQDLASEVIELKIPDQNKWLLVYQIAKGLYNNFPAQSKQLLQTLAETSTGTAKLLCLLSIGNISYLVEKNRQEAIKAYEQAIILASPTNLLLETPTYRLARLYAVEGYFYKAIRLLTNFVKLFPESRHTPYVYKTLGDIYKILKQPKFALKYYKYAIKLQPEIYEKNKSSIENLQNLTANLPEFHSESYIYSLAIKAQDIATQTNLATFPTTLVSTGTNQIQPLTSSKKLSSVQITSLDPQSLYQIYIAENSKPKPDENYCVDLLKKIIEKSSSSDLIQKAIKHFISWRFFKASNKTIFLKEADEILKSKNFDPETSELLYRKGQIYELAIKDYQSAIKTYFEFISLFPNSSRIPYVRIKIPQLYELLGDNKNALKFYTKVIDDASLPAELRATAALSKAKIEEYEQKKEDAIKTLNSALEFKSTKLPEIYIRLEKLTDNFDYIYKALDTDGDEDFRFEALKVIKSRLEKDKKFSELAKVLEKYSNTFENPEYLAWIQKQRISLEKLDQIKELERLIENYPEEPQTPQRLFKLANLVEGTEYSNYKARDLFYEITLLYPWSEFFKESKIRAENSKAIKNLQEIEYLLNKGLPQYDTFKYMLIAAKINYQNLENISKAKEYLEALLKLDPSPEIKAEALLILANITYKYDKDTSKAIEFLQNALLLTKDLELRNEIINNILQYNKFKQDNLSSDLINNTNFTNQVNHPEFTNIASNTKNSINLFNYSENLVIIYKSEFFTLLQTAFSLWQKFKKIDEALELLQNIIKEQKFRNYHPLTYYWIARIQEDKKLYNEALNSYKNAYKSLYHPCCRKDMVLYRIAKLYQKINNIQQSYNAYNLLVTKYPKSLLSRSALYNLYKIDLSNGNLKQAHNWLSRLLIFKSLHPQHRKEIQKLYDNLSAKLFISEITRMKSTYTTNSQDNLSYFVAKVFESNSNDIDLAIKNYENYLKNSISLPISKVKDTLLKIADLYEKKNDYVKTIYYLDQILQALGPTSANFDIILRIGNIIEDKLYNVQLLELFWQTIYFDYDKVPIIRNFAKNKLNQIRKIALAKAAPVAKPKKKVVKREYSEKDKQIIEALEEIKKKYIDDLQDYAKAEQEMLDLWDENKDSLANYEIMRELVDLCENKLLDLQKAAEYMKKWLDENPDDPDITAVTMKLYDLYFEKLKDGDKALNLLKEFISKYPNSPDRNSIILKIGLVNEKIIKNFDEARRTYQLLIDMRRNDPIVHEAYYRMGFVLRDGYADYTNAIKTWEELNNLYYQNNFAADALYAIAETYEIYIRNYTNARIYYEKILNQYPNTPLQNKIRDALLRIRGK